MRLANRLTLLSAVLMLGSPCFASSAARYTLTLTNGSATPLSPPIVYVTSSAAGHAVVGQKASPGFIEVCKTGMTQTRVRELNAEGKVSNVLQPPANVILPGQSVTFEVGVQNPNEDVIRFETMYGKSKDVCGIGGIGSQILVALQNHSAHEFISKDDVVVTGAYTNPSIPANASAGTDACMSADNAVACLRQLSNERNPASTIAYFTPYFPSLINFIEQKYGAMETQSLLFPDSGAIQIKLTLKH